MRNSFYQLLFVAYIVVSVILVWGFLGMGCNLETKTVTESTTLGDLRIEKTEYWSGCWKHYWVEEMISERRIWWIKDGDTLSAIVPLHITTKGTCDSMRYYQVFPTYKDSLICSDYDSVRYEIWDDQYEHSTRLLLDWCPDCVVAESLNAIVDTIRSPRHWKELQYWKVRVDSIPRDETVDSIHWDEWNFDPIVDSLLPEKQEPCDTIWLYGCAPSPFWPEPSYRHGDTLFWIIPRED